MKMKVLGTLALIGAAAGLVFLVPMRWGIWLPDVPTGNLTVLDQMTTPAGDVFQLSQKYTGDGYLTRFIHTNNRGRAWKLTIDGDADKAWRGRIERLNDDTIQITVLSYNLRYSVGSHAVVDYQGNQGYVLEIPEDGSPPFVPHKKAKGAP
jgi:hypothetical protein